RQDLESHQPVELLLPRLVDGAHAALAEELEDFQLGEVRCQVRRRRRPESGRIRPGEWADPGVLRREQSAKELAGIAEGTDLRCGLWRRTLESLPEQAA